MARGWWALAGRQRAVNRRQRAVSRGFLAVGPVARIASQRRPAGAAELAPRRAAHARGQRLKLHVFRKQLREKTLRKSRKCPKRSKDVPRGTKMVYLGVPWAVKFYKFTERTESHTLT